MSILNVCIKVWLEIIYKELSAGEQLGACKVPGSFTTQRASPQVLKICKKIMFPLVP